MKSLVAASASSALALILSAVGISPALADQSSAFDCHASLNIYRADAAQAKSCGYSVYPRQKVVSLPRPDGISGSAGSAVEYPMGRGIIAEQIIPPVGFKPLTATNAELNEYGFPPRPSGGADLVRWEKEMSNWKGSGPATPFLAAVNASTNAYSDTEYSQNWAGYVIQSSTPSMTQAQGWWIEPSAHSSRCSNTAESTWAGLGGFVTSDTVLAQNGTAIGVPGIAAHQAWWEFYPANSMVAIDFSATAGFTFSASTRYAPDSSATDRYRFWYYNEATGLTDAFDLLVSDYLSPPIPSLDGYPSHSAEVIIERPKINGQYSNLLNFETLYVDESQANGADFNTYPKQWSNGLIRHGEHMYYNDTDFADVSGISSPGYYYVTQHNCS